jgi:hypothetical protein
VSLGVFRENGRVMIDIVGVLEVTTEWCLTLFVFWRYQPSYGRHYQRFRGNGRVVFDVVGVVEVTTELWQALSVF